MYLYSLRFQLLPDVDFGERMKNLLDFCEKADIDDVMFFIGAEEVGKGHITVEQAKVYTDVIARAGEILRARGITVSLNPWVTLGHYDGGRRLQKGQNFRNMVGHDGVKAQVAVCPLDKNWREYYVNLLQFYVDTLKPRVLWLEDDMRLSNHEPVILGCFCDEHIALINEKSGTHYTREEIVNSIVSDMRVREAYLDTARFTIADTVRYIAENVKGDFTFGLMTGGSGLSEGRVFGELFGYLGNGREKPYNRICLCSYRQRGLQEYAWSLNKSSAHVRALTGDAARCVSEMENYPHTLYTKTANYFAYQLLTSVQLGFDGATFSIFEFNGNGAINYGAYADVLHRLKPYLSLLREIGISPENAVGVNILISEKSAYTVRPEVKSIGELNGSDSWLYAFLEQIGVASRFTFDTDVKGAVIAASGQVLRNFDKNTLTRLFRDNFMILTADNVLALFDMGLEGLIGAKSYKLHRLRGGDYTMEQLCGDGEVYGIKKLRATAQFFCGDYLEIEYAAGAVKYTELLDYDGNMVGSGITRSGNALVIPYTDADGDAGVRYPAAMICYLREHAVKCALKEFASDNFYCFIKEENVCPYAFEKDGKTYVVCVDFVDDGYEKLHLQTNRDFKTIKIITPENPTAAAARYVKTEDGIIIEEFLKPQSSYVLVFE